MVSLVSQGNLACSLNLVLNKNFQCSLRPYGRKTRSHTRAHTHKHMHALVFYVYWSDNGDIMSHIECLVHYLLPEHDLSLRWTSSTSCFWGGFAYGYIDSSQAVCCDMTAGHAWICLPVCLPLLSFMDRVGSGKKNIPACVFPQGKYSHSHLPN